MSLKATLAVIVFFTVLSESSSQDYCNTSNSVKEFCPYGCCGSGLCQRCCDNKIAIGVGSAVAIAVALMIISGIFILWIQKRYANAFHQKHTRTASTQTVSDKNTVPKAEPPPKGIMKHRRESTAARERAWSNEEQANSNQTTGSRRQSTFAPSRQPSAISRYTNRRESVNTRMDVEDIDDSISRDRIESTVSEVGNQESLLTQDTHLTNESQLFEQVNPEEVDGSNLPAGARQDVEIINEEDLV